MLYHSNKSEHNSFIFNKLTAFLIIFYQHAQINRSYTHNLGKKKTST